MPVSSVIKKIYFFLIILVLLPAVAAAKQNTFAVIVDSISYSKILPELNLYLQAVQQDGLDTEVLQANWKNPEQIREEILSLNKRTGNLEGVVFIGDIPVPMIRDAQHLTSAFKIDQTHPRYSWKRTSVPSDRFYDDFDLKFTFLKQDSSDRQLFYYALDPDSPQKIQSDIYSARIKAPVQDDSKYDLIARYLKRVAEQKVQQNPLDNAFVFTGHGYHTEALDAWSSNLISYREQFPQLFQQGAGFKMYDHTMSPNIKYLLMRALQDSALDMAIFHAHGADDTQYLVGFEPATNITQNVEAIKLFLRSKLRTAKRRKVSVEAAQQGYQQRYDLPDSWFADIFSDSLELADSLLYASQDMHISEIQSMQPQAKLLYFDECFNGAFINSPYVAGSYIFNNRGASVAGIANTVNVLQDIWSDQFLGLLNDGVRVGEWLLLQNSLEKHLIGDPTFHFSSTTENRLTNNFRKKIQNSRVLKKWLKSSEIPLRNLAVAQIYGQKGQSFEKKLVSIFKRDPAANVRLQALKALADLNSPAFLDVLLLAAKDPFELIRRFAAAMMGDTGREKYLESLAEMRIFDVSDRVRFNADRALEQIGPLKALDACLAKINELPASKFRTELEVQVKRSFNYDANTLNNEILVQIADTSVALKKRISSARRLRNYRYQSAVPLMIETILKTDENELVQETLLEALGWYGLNFRAPEILKACQKILSSENYSAALNQLALSTKNRINQGSNDPVIR